jgi:hypothetical protein
VSAYVFAGTCLDSTYEDIRALVDRSSRISLEEFRAALSPGAWEKLVKRLGYDRRLRIEDDPVVRCGEGLYRGRPAVFLVWSGIEHIFTEGTAR